MAKMTEYLLQLAVNDNIHWCSALCNAHGADDDLSASPWFNLKPSPRYYPNIISREPGSQAQVCKEIERLRSLNIPKGWGIKDSFSDLVLDHLGFEIVVHGNWFGGVPTTPSRPPENWKKAQSVHELRSWQVAWGEESDVVTFPEALLNDNRIEFWCKSENAPFEAGFVCFRTESSVGLSNWFSSQNQSLCDLGALDVISASSPGVPVVFWSSDLDDGLAPEIERLGQLKVWISTY